jgi:T5SS/PEP-CTERM-associated repeat protein
VFFREESRACKSSHSFLAEHKRRQRAIRPGVVLDRDRRELDPVATPPTSIDDVEIDTAAIVSGSGSAGVFNINAAVTVSGSLNTDVTTIGNSSLGLVTVGAGTSWTLSHELWVGGVGDGHVIVTGGGSLTTDAANAGASTTFDGIGFGAGIGSVLVIGAGSKWTSHAGSSVGVGPSGTLNVSNGGEVQAHGFYFANGSMSVDGSSVMEAGTVGGAQTGSLTIDPNGYMTGIGTFTATLLTTAISTPPTAEPSSAMAR